MGSSFSLQPNTETNKLKVAKLKYTDPFSTRNKSKGKKLKKQTKSLGKYQSLKAASQNSYFWECEQIAKDQKEVQFLENRL